jgi:3-dehydroquinate dehydratase-2
VHVVVLHGPNLSLLGTREPTHYGTRTLAEIDADLGELALELGVDLDITQTNHEGELIDRLHGALRDGAAGVVINPGAYAHTSLAIADAVRAVAPLPVVEVHLSNTSAREPERRVALVGAACAGRVEGMGPLGYALALRAVITLARTGATAAST